MNFTQYTCPLTHVRKRVPVEDTAVEVEELEDGDTTPPGWGELTLRQVVENPEHGEWSTQRAATIANKGQVPQLAELDDATVGALFDQQSPEPSQNVAQTVTLGPYSPEGIRQIVTALQAAGVVFPTAEKADEIVS